MKKKDTKLRKAVPFAKRFAIVLHWLAHSLSFMQVSALYAVAKSTVISIVHEGVSVLLQRLVPVSIKFPTGSELDQVITDLESLCGLPFCVGAIDGTFMEIKKPTEFGDTYYCYKHFNAIIILGCVDARGIFTYVNAGRPGSVGDAYVALGPTIPRTNHLFTFYNRHSSIQHTHIYSVLISEQHFSHLTHESKVKNMHK